MTTFDIGQYRLYNQGISQAGFGQAAQVVAHLLAIQAQDYSGALWSVGLRMNAATPAIIEQAVTGRAIIRTWPMRGTLHFVAASDARWMLKLLTPRIISGMSSRHRELELDDTTFSRSRELFTEALAGGKQLSRPAMLQVLERGGISTAGQRGPHILGRLSQEGLLCFGSYQDKQHTFVLLEEWLPPAKELDRDEALAELAKRYFTGHGPATLADLERWAGLRTSEARAALEMAKSHLQRKEANGQTYWFSKDEPVLSGKAPAAYLLPGFDEYILGYKDRSAVLEPQYNQRIVPGNNGMFMSTIVSEGRVVGTWKRTIKKDKIIIVPAPFTSLTKAEMESFAFAAGHYGRFMNMPVELK